MVIDKLILSIRTNELMTNQNQISLIFNIFLTTIIYFTLGDESVLSTFLWYFAIMGIFNLMALIILKCRFSRQEKIERQIDLEIIRIFEMRKEEFLESQETMQQHYKEPLTITKVPEEIMGYYNGKSFPPWVELSNGKIFGYLSVAPRRKNGDIDIYNIEDGLFLTPDGLLYKNELINGN